MLLTWLSTSAFLLIGELGLTRPQASAIYALGSAAYLGGSLIGVRVSRSFSAMTILRIAGPLLLLGALGAGRGARRGLSSLGGHPRLRRPVLLRLGSRPADGDRHRHAPFRPHRGAGFGLAWLDPADWRDLLLADRGGARRRLRDPAGHGRRRPRLHRQRGGDPSPCDGTRRPIRGKITQRAGI